MGVVGRAFGVQFQESIDFLKGKIAETSLAWNSLAGPVHAKVFTVAGSTKVDLVKDLHQALVDAKTQGTTISDFRKRFDKAVAEHGWTYHGTRGWRTGVIFHTNMNTADMAGRWKQLWENREDRPYLQYRTAGDGRVRPLHQSWNGAIYPITASWWDWYYPPNGWGCRCGVRSYSAADIKGRKLTVQEPPPIQYRDVINTKTGEITDRVPVGIDSGWDHNVGKSWQQAEVELGRKLMSLPEQLRGPMIERTISPAFQQAIKADWMAFQTAVEGGQQTGFQVVGYTDAETVAALRQIGQQVPEISSNAIGVTAATAERLATKGTGWSADDLANIPLMLRDYQAVLWDTQDELLHILPNEGPVAKGKAGVIKLAIQPPGRGKLDGALAVQGVGVERLSDLAGDRYKVLLGRLPKVVATRQPLTLKEFSASLERSGLTLADTATAKSIHKASGGMLDPEAIATAMTGSDGKGLTINLVGTAVVIEGDGVTIYGAAKCNIARKFLFADKERYVLHSVLEIKKGGQGAGAVKAMMRAVLSEYERMGMERIKLYANLDVGGYAWARYGFTPAEGAKISSEAGAKLARLAKANDLPDPAKAELQALQSVYSDHQDGGIWVSMVAHAKTPALDDYLRKDGSYGDPSMPGGLTAAKALLLNSGWSGELLLSDDAAMKKLRSYIDASR